jgi:hypothetical protein
MPDQHVGYGLLVEPMNSKVNMLRVLNIQAMMLLLLFSAPLSAVKHVPIGTPLGNSPQIKQGDKKWYYPFEIGELKIRQSNDGTGIIKNVTCLGCDYQLVKITAGTKVIVNGQEVDLLRARERAGKNAYIEFDRDTAVVKHIYWAE